jgi:hypothetical protein
MLVNRSTIHRRFIRLVYNLTLAGPSPLKVLSRQMASLLLRARSFGRRKGAKLLHPRFNWACCPPRSWGRIAGYYGLIVRAQRRL